MTSALDATREPLERDSPSVSDEEIVRRIVAGESALYGILMRRYNQRLFRIVRSIVGSSSEAEDVVQQAYIATYLNLGQFEGRSTFSTWLTRVAIHEALARVRLRKRREQLLGSDGDAPIGRSLDRDPEQQATIKELARLFEEACDALPDPYRVVFIMRGIEEMSTAETAECLDVTQETVKVRFHRARALLRESFNDDIAEAAREAFSFLGKRCARLTGSVTSALRIPLPPPA
ncbi:MAG TPA: RNA polymerase sigma factor [Polyangiaceae bacterium]